MTLIWIYLVHLFVRLLTMYLLPPPRTVPGTSQILNRISWVTDTMLYLESSLSSNNKAFVNWMKFVSLTLSHVSIAIQSLGQGDFLVDCPHSWKGLSPTEDQPHFGYMLPISLFPLVIPTHPCHSGYTFLVFSFSICFKISVLKSLS